MPRELVATVTDGRTEYHWAGHEVTSSKRTTVGLRFVDPVVGGRYVLDATIPADAQAVPLRAVGGTAPYAFTVDGQAAAGTWHLLLGTHDACVTDATGLRRCTRFTVSR